MANENTFSAGSTYTNYWSTSDGGNNGYYHVGNFSGGDLDGAIRFPGVTGTGNCNAAWIYLHCDDRSGSSGSMAWNTWGIDEDNTAAFSSSPLGRTKTSATFLWEEGTMPSPGSFIPNKDVASIVNEIRGRGGWSSGNAIGFIFNQGGGDALSWISGGPADTSPSTISSLVIREGADPDTTFDSQTLRIGASTPLENYGIKITQDGVSALISTPKDKSTIVASSKFLLKVKVQGSIAGTAPSINHLLNYTPSFLSYIEDGAGRRYKMPVRMFFSKSEEYAGSFSTDSTLSLYVNNYLQGGSSSKEFYYYVFIEQL